MPSKKSKLEADIRQVEMEMAKWHWMTVQYEGLEKSLKGLKEKNQKIVRVEP